MGPLSTSNRSRVPSLSPTLSPPLGEAGWGLPRKGVCSATTVSTSGPGVGYPCAARSNAPRCAPPQACRDRQAPHLCSSPFFSNHTWLHKKTSTPITLDGGGGFVVFQNFIVGVCSAPRHLSVGPLQPYYRPRAQSISFGSPRPQQPYLVATRWSLLYPLPHNGVCSAPRHRSRALTKNTPPQSHWKEVESVLQYSKICSSEANFSLQKRSNASFVFVLHKILQRMDGGMIIYEFN